MNGEVGSETRDAKLVWRGPTVTDAVPELSDGSGSTSVPPGVTFVSIGPADVPLKASLTSTGIANSSHASAANAEPATVTVRVAAS